MWRRGIPARVRAKRATFAGGEAGGASIALTVGAGGTTSRRCTGIGSDSSAGRASTRRAATPRPACTRSSTRANPGRGARHACLPGMARRRGRAASGCPRWCSFTAAAARPSRTGSRWNGRGYAALAMDTCGGVPVWSESPFGNPIWPRHPHAGPHGWGRYEESARPPRDQWMYHAVAAVIRGHSAAARLSPVGRPRPRWPHGRLVGRRSWPASRRESTTASASRRRSMGYRCFDTDAVGLYTTLPPRRWFDLSGSAPLPARPGFDAVGQRHERWRVSARRLSPVLPLRARSAHARDPRSHGPWPWRAGRNGPKRFASLPTA